MPKAGRILVTGCRGQLGQEFMSRLSAEYEVIGVGREEMDVTDRDRVEQILLQARPQVVLHTAAMTNVDECETKPDLAMAVNAQGTANVAEACRRVDARLVYFSTDYVFDGAKGIPYCETDPVNPLSVYGQSKLDGERAALERLENVTVCRISWVYGKSRQHFVRAIMVAARKQMLSVKDGQVPLRIVDDQFSSPTPTTDIVQQTMLVIEHRLRGVIHVTAEGGCSRFRMAQEIFDTLGLTVNYVPCAMDEFPQVARRPRYTVMENGELHRAGLDAMRPWRDSLRQFLCEHRRELLS